jgi:hypothetical protein
MKRRDFIKLSAGLSAGLAATGLMPPSPAMAQTKAVFKASDVQPPGYPTVAAAESLGKKLEAATYGRLSVRMYPSTQLGGEKETIEQTQIGAVQLLRVSAGALGPIVDEINVVNMPFLFRNTTHAEKMMDGPLGQELLDKITANANAGLVGLCWMNSGARSRRVHDCLGQPARRSDLAQYHCGLSIPVGRRHVFADSNRRLFPAAFHHRAYFSRIATGGTACRTGSDAVRLIEEGIRWISSFCLQPCWCVF